ncbi:MAG: hypothetical protein FWC96_01465 [Oscillospiraceae bacterium]|nr:hypothetical protein [Oscillospiraceae bacterium]
MKKIKNATGDIWIHSGGFCFHSGNLPPDYDWQSGDFHTQSLPWPAYPANSANPISGELNGRSIYVLDDTPLFFGETDGIAEVFGIRELNVSGGTLCARSVRAKSGLFIAPGCTVRVGCEISSGGIIECYGGDISAASIDARQIRFDSAGGPLCVSIQSSVVTERYEQHGGNVTIGGGLFSGADSAAVISVNGDYAYHNPAALSVNGDIISAGGIMIGKPGQNTRVTVLGNMRAERVISISGGKTFIRGMIESRTGDINVIGGIVNAGSLNAAGELAIGTAEDFYGLNSRITVFIADKLHTKSPVRISGGAVYDGGNIA